MKKIMLFMAYYGKLPNYFELWMKAIEFNETIDFCLITDCPVNHIPNNAKLVLLSFEEFKNKIQSKFDFKISLNNYGRISQFRPAFAYVFEEEVKGYDYWGFIECDLIPGDIRKFLTDEILEKYDKIFKLGHFQIFKNNEQMNVLFMKKVRSAVSYRFAFSRNILFFEELIGMHNIALSENVKTYTNPVFADIKAGRFAFYRSGYGYTNKDSDEAYIFVYNKGKLYSITLDESWNMKKEEVLYVHLQKRTMEITCNSHDEYLIIPNKFIDFQEVSKSDYLEILSQTQSGESEYQEKMSQRFKLDKKRRYKDIDWWLYYLVRLRLKYFHKSIGLSGK